MPGNGLVLVVDDDPLNRALLTMGLEAEGYDVVEASDGHEALAAIAERAPDVVLTDIEMPSMNGYELLRERHESPAIRDIPFIVISAVDDMASVVRCIELGAEDYLPKPFDAVLLRARMTACLEKRRLREQEKQLFATVAQQAEELRQWNRELERRVEEKVREVDRWRRLEGFVAPQLAQLIVSGGDDILASHRREITVLFCDLRGFTSFAEMAEPEEVSQVLQELHDAVGPLIFEFEGTVPYFTGDGLMVIFNDPLPCTNPAERAVRLAVGMRDRAAELAHTWNRRGYQLELGIGIAIGYATCGRIGFEGRMEYTAVGTVTNLAARLCGAAAGGQVLVTQRIYAMVEPIIIAEEMGTMEFKGFARPSLTYNIRDLRDSTTESPPIP